MAQQAAAEPQADEKTELERVLRPFLLVPFIIGDIIGSGITSASSPPPGSCPTPPTPRPASCSTWSGAPGIPIDAVFPFLSVFAVGNTALINMLMASRLVYGMAEQGMLPPVLGEILATRRSPWAAIAFTTALALGLITYVRTQSGSNIVSALSGTTACCGATPARRTPTSSERVSRRTPRRWRALRPASPGGPPARRGRPGPPSRHPWTRQPPAAP